MATEELADRWRGLRRFTIVVAALGVASAVAASVLHFGSPDPSAIRTFATLGLIGAVAAGAAAVMSRTTGWKAIFAMLAVSSFIASSSVFGMTFS
ncbi:hypothetical protein [Microbacterium sp. LWO12-1.2]|uniref:hypothetical protein n=1 Tax=Microbacterium sp. LWO12-1.2 TaxID=3135261 RepID=UPI00342095F4